MDDSFQNYCMVCDCLIVAAPPPPSSEQIATGTKKRPTGAIRIKNADGTTTTRTANGAKTTKPTRLVGGAALLAAAAAKAKGLPPPAPTPAPTPTSTSTAAANPVSPKTKPSSKLDIPQQQHTRSPPSPPTPPAFESTIYCSVSCMAKDAAVAPTDELKRVFGGSDAAHAPIPSPIAPPSPLLANSDTDSSASASLAAVVLRAQQQTPENQNHGAHLPKAAVGSAPKTMEYFRVRENPDDAWRDARDVDRRRRSSVAARRPMEPVLPVAPMSRQRSGPGSGPHSASGASSDSLSSLWNSDHDNYSGIQRTVSTAKNGGLHAMTPMDSHPPAARRSMSTTSDGSTPVRPIARSALSHSSLGMLASPSSTGYEVGSAPSHTAYLMHSYASAFPLRDGGLSGSATPSDVRSTSVSIVPIPVRPCPVRHRSSRTGTTWDSFAKSELELRDRTRRGTTASEDLPPRDDPSPPTSAERPSRGRAGSASESTPTLQNGAWHLCYSASASRPRSRSREPSSGPGAGSRMSPSPHTPSSAGLSIPLPIPERGCLPTPSSLLAPGPMSPLSTMSTPQGRRISAGGMAMGTASPAGGAGWDLKVDGRASATATPPAKPVSPSPGGGSLPRRDSYPRPGFDWEARTPHRTYELPKGVVANPNKGLFYFNV